jgi:hypothetical protein
MQRTTISNGKTEHVIVFGPTYLGLGRLTNSLHASRMFDTGQHGADGLNAGVRRQVERMNMPPRPAMPCETANIC